MPLCAVADLYAAGGLVFGCHHFTAAGHLFNQEKPNAFRGASVQEMLMCGIPGRGFRGAQKCRFYSVGGRHNKILGRKGNLVCSNAEAKSCLVFGTCCTVDLTAV